ncbi:MAG: S-layer homology domain-containing protein, partial [Clostridia bacterium]|nr:S-layer homology domain-containing protein [Clostridia bacterium]
SQEADGGYKTRTYACQDQLSKIQSFSSHKYYSEYMANLEEQIDTLIDEVESALDSDPIGQKALLDSLKTSRSTIQLIMEGMGDLPTMKVDGINQRNRYTISFKRKKTLDDSLSASISVVVTDKEGTEIDTAQKDFDADSLELKISFNAPATKYTKGEMYTITAYYHINDADYLIDSQEHECYYIRTTQSGGLGGNGGSSSNLGNTGGDDTNTPTTGGTIFPDSNDDPETPTTPKTTFNDLKDYTWAAEAIDTLYEAGIINGMEEGIFNPAGQVTREQFCKMVVALFDIPAKASTTAFGDVKSDAWYAPYITAAVQAGYVQGQSNEYFGIGESIMRQDMAVILYRALGDQNSKVVLNFSDKENIASYAEDAISELVGLGILNGYEDGSFQPRGTATRAEAAKMIYGIYQYLND